ncbi:unnamed protein product [Menidia menidia]|uniref:(Atlantic silverside) hypothetical protein n=1 Tax=Menidia menidia TaxID=238744 RepID=A0A8S4BMP1_9TELE|nr:unnamed protein product [Menidia menidia]
MLVSPKFSEYLHKTAEALFKMQQGICKGTLKYSPPDFFCCFFCFVIHHFNNLSLVCVIMRRTCLTGSTHDANIQLC